MEPSPRVNNVVKLALLLLLREGPTHGYALIQDARRRTGAKVGPNQVYPFLEELRRKGHVTVAADGGRKKYRLTARGRAFVDSLLGQFAGVLDSALGARVKTCAHCGCKVLSGGVEERVGGKRLAFCCRACAEAAKRKTMGGRENGH